MKKPDRAERVVAKYGERSMDEYHTCVLTDREVIGLLRKEHAWMRRTIQKRQRSIDGLATDLHPDFVDGYTQACVEFLYLLDQRRK